MVPLGTKQRRLVPGMKTIPIGLLGLGTVGTGVIQILKGHAGVIEQRLGARIVVKRIAVKHLDKSRADFVPIELITQDANDVIADPDIKIVVELIGGTTDARDYVLRAIEHGKHVVTANKALLAIHGAEIFGAASEKGVDVFYEAAVGGGIPIIRTLREALASERIQTIAGILNGTTNFILTAMADDGAGFDETLARAQSLGYAEADPTADVDGHDAAQKLTILASLGFSTRLSVDDVHVEGIRTVTSEDIAAAKSYGYAIKLVGIAERRGDAVSLRVHPCWVPKDSLLAHVNGVLNAVLLESDALGNSMLLGQGAGALPTGSAVSADIIDLSRQILLGSAGQRLHSAHRNDPSGALSRFELGDVESAFYLCFTVKDSPGVLARIAGALGDEGVSLKVVNQEMESTDGSGAVPVVVITHTAPERAVRTAVEKVNAFDTIASPTRSMRILKGLG